VAAGDPPCPTTLLAPEGLDLVPAKCDTPDCLLDFKKYKWWTSFNFRGASFKDKSYYWNDDLKNPFAPKNAFVDACGLHLTIQNRGLGGPDSLPRHRLDCRWRRLRACIGGWHGPRGRRAGRRTKRSRRPLVTR
jgi:hypothetical protein